MSRLLPLAGAVLLATAPAPAQPAGPAPATDGQTAAGTIIPAEDTSLVRVETLRGMKVVNGAGEEVGVVDDVVLDKDGKVSGLVVEAGGVMGVGGKAIGIVWRDVGDALQSNVVRVSLTKDDIDKAPPFKVNDHTETPVPRQPHGLVPLQPDSPPR